MTGAEILFQVFQQKKVEVIFGYPGGTVLPIFDCLYSSPVRFILCRHEQAAAHAADGYARATGRTGVCLATSGPGATNLITGLAAAYLDSIPVLAITGQVRSSLIGIDAFQEVDITGITRSITKHNYLVRDVRELEAILDEAFYICQAGRPGPVLIDFPIDIQNAETEFHGRKLVDRRQPVLLADLTRDQLTTAVRMIKNARAPVIISGGGVIASRACQELITFAEKNQIPVAMTLMGLGSFPASHFLALGMMGMHGSYHANQAVMSADLVIGIGVRFDDRVTGPVETFAPRARILHIDIDPTSIDKTIKADLALVGDARTILRRLNHLTAPSYQTRSWLNRIAEWHSEHPLRYDRTSGKIKPQYVIEEIARLTRGQAIIVTEVGQNQMWTAQWYKHENPRCFISSGGLGAMGFGLPAAIGARVGQPDHPVFVIGGDGSIQMNIQELATCCAYDLQLKVAILNNGSLGMVRQWQELFYGKRYSQVMLSNPDFAKVAEGFGAVGMRVWKKDDVTLVLEQALATDNTVVIDFKVDPQENVMPMVPPGAPLNDMLELSNHQKGRNNDAIHLMSAHEK